MTSLLRRTGVTVFVVVLLAGCSSGSSKTATVKTGPSSAPPAAASPADANALRIASFQYGPNPLTVAAGAVIPVTNHDEAEHTVTSDKAGLFLADDIGQDKTISFTAPKTPGTYTFHCEYHKSMHGTLIVK